MIRDRFTEALKAVRYWFHPKAKDIDDRTVQIDQNIEELRRQKLLTTEMIAKVNQPDVLRSLVISMSKPNG